MRLMFRRWRWAAEHTRLIWAAMVMLESSIMPRFLTLQDEMTEASPTRMALNRNLQLMGRPEEDGLRFVIVQLQEVCVHPVLYVSDVGCKYRSASVSLQKWLYWYVSVFCFSFFYGGGGLFYRPDASNVWQVRRISASQGNVFCYLPGRH